MKENLSTFFFIVKQAKEEHKKAFDEAAARAAAAPEDSGNEGEVVQTIALHTPTLYTHHALPYALAPAPAFVRTIVPQSFAYSVQTHGYPYYFTAA